MAGARELFETNTLGLIAMTRAVLPQMRERRAGVIVNVSSSVTLRPLPLLSVYTASKAAVNAFTESLALELEPFGIRARLVIPGRAPDTSFGDNARARMAGGVLDAYAGFVQRVLDRRAGNRPRHPRGRRGRSGVAGGDRLVMPDAACRWRGRRCNGGVALIPASERPSGTHLMTHKQHPLGSPFTPASTADDVLASIDLTNGTSSSPAGMPASVSRSSGR